MADVHVRVPDALAEAARSASGLGPDATTGAVARWSMATAAGWPPAAAEMAARTGPSPADNETETEEAR